MNLKDLQSNWEAFGQTDPLWAILTDPTKKGNQWELDEFFKTGWYKIRDVMNNLEKVHPHFDRKKALDFGCGVGRLSRNLCEHFEEVNGVDIAPSMINKAKELNKYPDRCHFHLNEADDLSLFADSSFDFVYSNITLQHIRPVYSKNYLREFMRILKPGGVSVFQLPDRRSMSRSQKLTTRVKDFIRWVLSENFVNGFKAFKQLFSKGPYMEMNAVPQTEVEALIREHGGEIVDIRRDSESGDNWISYQYTVLKK